VLGYLYTGSVKGTAPPSVDAIKFMSTLLLVFVLWFVWIDRTRESRHPA
jgi:low temperature requirement protein LtrA